VELRWTIVGMGRSLVGTGGGGGGGGRAGFNADLSGTIGTGAASTFSGKGGGDSSGPDNSEG
jgi:hypothetical protein